MNILQISGLALSAVALAVLLRQYRAEYALALGLVVSAVILMALMPVLKETMELLIDIASKSGVSQTLSIIVKSLGIAFVAGIAADICRDAGESAMAAKVELAGKVAILSMAMPMAAQLMELFERILQ